jgi:hypothetical protein
MKLKYMTINRENQIMGFTGNRGSGIGTHYGTFWSDATNNMYESNDVGNINLDTVYHLKWATGPDNKFKREVNGIVH